MNERISAAERFGVTALLFLERRLEQRLESSLIPIGIAIGLASVILARPYLETLLIDPTEAYFNQLSSITPSVDYSLQGDWKQDPGVINVIEHFPKNKGFRLLPQQGYDMNPFGNLYFQQSSKGIFIAIDGNQLKSWLGDTNSRLNRPIGIFLLDHQTPQALISIPENFDIQLDDWLRDLKETDYQKARKKLSVKLSASIVAGVETIAQYGSGSSQLAIKPENLAYQSFERKRSDYEKQLANDNGRLIAIVLAFDPRLLPR